MSIEIMSAVWRQSRQKGSALLLLLSLADYADEHGMAYPSVETLAKKVRMSPRNVQILLRKLASDGELIIEANAGPGGANCYLLTLPKGGEKFSPPSTPKTMGGGEKFSPRGGESRFTGGVKAVSPGGESRFTGGVKAVSPDPSLDPSIQPSVDPSVVVDDDAPERPDPPRVIVHRNQPQTSDQPDVEDHEPSPPVADTPPPELGAVAESLLATAMCANESQARLDAARLLADHPAEWIIRAAVQTADRPAVKNPYGYMVKTLENWHKENGPRPAARADPSDEDEATRRRKYIPDEYSDIILG